MIKSCKICNKEFETNYSNKKYCSNECSQEATRQADRLRKKKEREIVRKKQTAQEIKKRKLKKIKVDKDTEERARAKKADLKRRLEQGDPKAKMEISKKYSIEYWEAYKEDFIKNQYNKNYTRYVNDINIYDNNFAKKVFNSIEELGRIYSILVSDKGKK